MERAKLGNVRSILLGHLLRLSKGELTRISRYKRSGRVTLGKKRAAEEQVKGLPCRFEFPSEIEKFC